MRGAGYCNEYFRQIARPRGAVPRRARLQLPPLGPPETSGHLHRNRRHADDGGRCVAAGLCRPADRRARPRDAGGRDRRPRRGHARSDSCAGRDGRARRADAGDAAPRLHGRRAHDAAADGGRGARGLLEGAALRGGVARQHLRRLDRAQGDARHVGDRPVERHAAAGAAALLRGAGRLDRPARLLLAADGAGGDGGWRRLHRHDRIHVHRLYRAGGATSPTSGTPRPAARWPTRSPATPWSSRSARSCARTTG